jgi:N-carbamoylputrescine amidase
MTRSITLAAIQFSPSDGVQANIDRVAGFVEQAAGLGADVVLPPELFCGHYFCKTQEEEHFARALPWQTHPAVLQLSVIAKKFGVVIPVSIYEKDGPAYYNSLVMLDADGTALGVYRKSHIPDGPGYQEKFYFRPGNTGFRVWHTKKGRIGVGICWDQWFPEAARAMTLMGADVLLYPTAIGAEPQDSGLDTAARWRRAMLGHAVSNVIPVCAANRMGDEGGQIFYGTSFIADQTGEVVADFGRTDEGVILATFDLDMIDRDRAAWGFFRDRRPDLYGSLI